MVRDTRATSTDMLNSTRSLPLLIFFSKLFMLLQSPQFFSLSPPPSSPVILLPLFMSLGRDISSLASPFSILLLTSPHLFYTYQLVLLNPFTLYPVIPDPSPTGHHPNVLHICGSVSVLLVCLVCFLDSVVDSYVFIAILMFIVLIFFFFNKSL